MGKFLEGDETGPRVSFEMALFGIGSLDDVVLSNGKLNMARVPNIS